MANITKPIVLNETLQETNEILREALKTADSVIQVSTDGGTTYGDPITPAVWLALIEEDEYAAGTIFKITKIFNGKTMRFIVLGTHHDVLSNTDAGELEPSGDTAHITLQFYDMPFGKVNLGLPYEEEKTGNVRCNADRDTDISDCPEVTIDPIYPSNMHGYQSAVGLRQAEQAAYDGLAPWLKAAIKTVRKDIFIPEIDDGDNYEMFDSTSTVIAMENDRYGSQVDCKMFSLSAAEVGIIPNPSDSGNDPFPYRVNAPVYDEDLEEEVMTPTNLEGKKYALFNETYPYTSETEGDRRRPRYWNNQLWYYWLRTPFVLGSSSWGVVDYDGGVYDYGTYDRNGVAPAFCI